MAPRKSERLLQAPGPNRRSGRLRGLEPPPDATLLAPVEDPGNRVTKPQPAKAAKKTVRLDCATCDRNLSKSSFPTRITNKCAHNVTTCKACLKTWIATQLDNTTYDNLMCSECPEKLESADVKKYASKAVFERFDELERRGISEKVPGWRWCLNPKCRAGQVHQPLVEMSANVSAKTKAKKSDSTKANSKKGPQDTICVCHECGAKACVPCDRPYHEGETCAAFQQRQKQYEKDEKATLQTIEKECKQCPSCQKNIQKNGGCDQVRCTQCHTSFCFLCLTTYAMIDRQGHAAGCIYAKPGRIDPHAAHIVNNNNGGGMFAAVGAMWNGWVGN